MIDDVRRRLAPGDELRDVRWLSSPFRTPPVPTATALLRLGRVQHLADLGTAGPLHAATTADDPAGADPELRKFEALFGRDALRVDQFIGGLFPRLRRATVETLARTQGVQNDEAGEEEPGKIVHEWRDPDDPVARDITARWGWGWPYYGSVDATPLFVTAATQLFRAEPGAATVRVEQRDQRRRSLQECLDQAVDWMCRRIDDDPDGLLTYRRINPGGLENQTWRDSWSALSHADGSLPNFDLPVAALDVEAAAYDALVAAARHADDVDGGGGGGSAGPLRERARRLRQAVLERMWTEHGGVRFFAAALDFSTAGERRPLQTRIGDMGHLLTSGLLDGDGATEYRDAVVRELFGAGLLCSAGIRTLHADEVRYWPGGYHTGSSWLWQSMHVADGLDRHGFPVLATELRTRCRWVHRATGLLPEFARGADDRGVLNDRIVEVWQAADRRVNRLEQPPQEVQAWTAASLFAAERRAREHGPEDRTAGDGSNALERQIVEQLRDR